jgi:hypothetical protein
MVPAVSDGISPVPPYSGYWYLYKSYQYRALTFFGLLSQTVLIQFIKDISVLQPQGSRNCPGLGYSHFARHYSGNHYCFLFLRVLRCFSSPGLPTFKVCMVFNHAGCPIRISTDQLLCADPRSFSQLITSFVASESLGIPHTLLFTFFSYSIIYSFLQQHVNELFCLSVYNRGSQFIKRFCRLS